MGISGGLQVRNVTIYHTRIDSSSSAFSFIIARDSAVPSLKITVFYHPKPSLECYREESKPDLSNKRVLRTIGKTEKKILLFAFLPYVFRSAGIGAGVGALKSTPCLFSLFFKPLVLENKTRKAKKQTTVLFEITHSTTPAIFFL